MVSLRKIVFGYLISFLLFISSLVFSQSNKSFLGFIPDNSKNEKKLENIKKYIEFGNENWDDQFTGVNALNKSANSVITAGKDFYVCGSFTKIGNENYNCIAKWTSGTGWSKIGEGFPYAVLQIKIINDILYAGGEFGAHYGVSGKYISVWDGNKWSIPGGGVDNNVLYF